MNGKEELEEAIQDYELPAIQAADIRFDDGDSFHLSENHTDEELQRFWRFLDRDYDNGYGLQELFGIIVFNDGLVLKRAEYDGSEWWTLHTPITIQR